MLRNKIGPGFNTRIGSFFGFFFLLFNNPLLLQRERDFQKQKNKKNMDQF